MRARKTEQGYLLRLEKGESVIATLTDFCEKQGIQAGFFHGLGAVKNTVIGYYPLEKKEYVFETHPEDREVASMTGNIALVDGKPFIHLHAVLSACEARLGTIGGHVKETEVAVTLEIFLTRFGESVSRAMNDDIGLKLLDI
ncbi:MAG: DNA-binding protein [Candidatus Kaiserbacteria bacterium]|nr:DNA-binding protein [Candidatus Kaiserbacteria bacterium]